MTPSESAIPLDLGRAHMPPVKTSLLFALTACAEILGCYLPLTLHPTAAGRMIGGT